MQCIAFTQVQFSLLLLLELFIVTLRDPTGDAKALRGLFSLWAAFDTQSFGRRQIGSEGWGRAWAELPVLHVPPLSYATLNSRAQVCTVDFPGSLVGKESACNTGDWGSIPGSGRSPGEGNGNPLQYSCLEKSRGQRSLAGYSPWGCKSWTQLSN